MGQMVLRAQLIRNQSVNRGTLACFAMTHRAQTWTFLIASNTLFWIWLWQALA
jgi:hypothetical protein